jgi:hypothetical protein
MPSQSAGQTSAQLGVTEIDISSLGPKRIRAGTIRQELALYVLALAFIIGIMSAVGIPVFGIQLPEFVGLGLAILVAVYLLYLLLRLVERLFGGVRALERAGGSARVPHFGVTPDEARSRLRRHFATPDRSVKAAAAPAANTKSSLYSTAAILALLVACAAGTAVGHAAGHGWPIVVGTAFGGLASWLFRRAARAAQPQAASVLANDPRPPVLLLRSFADDGMLVDQRIKVLIDQQVTIRFEEAMSAWLSDFGPFIAVGEPGESLPQVGAARAYLSKDEWQSAVQGWISQASFIVMIAGASEWVRWELRQIMSKGRMAELLLLLPPPQSAAAAPRAIAKNEERWANVLSVLAATPWHAALRETPIERSLALHLRADGSVLAITGSGRQMRDYENASLLVLYSRFCQGRP